MADKKTVFISYSSRDREFVKQLVETLQAMGVACWVAPEMIPAGSSYAREIPKAIRECEVFLLLLSKTSQDSIWVEKETDSAISNRKNIIPFQLDDTPLNDAFRFYLNNVQMISYAQNPDMAMRELKEQLRELGQEATAGEEAVGNSEKTEEHKSFPRMGYFKGPRDSNALRINRIPLECKNCGSKNLKNISMGIYQCGVCGTDNYDDYQTIRNYLDKVGMASAIVIEKETGVPRRVINYFFREEYLEIPEQSTIRVPCEKCGAPIRTGVLCEDCKRKADQPKKKKDIWHSKW